MVGYQNSLLLFQPPGQSTPLIVVIHLSGGVPKLSKVVTIGVPKSIYSPLNATSPISHTAVESTGIPSGNMTTRFPSFE